MRIGLTVRAEGESRDLVLNSGDGGGILFGIEEGEDGARTLGIHKIPPSLMDWLSSPRSTGHIAQVITEAAMSRVAVLASAARMFVNSSALVYAVDRGDMVALAIYEVLRDPETGILEDLNFAEELEAMSARADGADAG